MISSAMSISPDPIELGKPVDVTFSGELNIDIPKDPSKTITQVLLSFVQLKELSVQFQLEQNLM